MRPHAPVSPCQPYQTPHLPQVFDDKRQFAEWFDSMLEAEGDGDDEDGVGNESEVRVCVRVCV